MCIATACTDTCIQPNQSRMKTRCASPRHLRTNTCTQPNQYRIKTGCVSPPRHLQTRVHNPTNIEWKPDVYRYCHNRHRMCIATVITDTGCVSPRPLQTRVHNSTKIELKPDVYRHGRVTDSYTRMKTGCVSPRPLQTGEHDPTKWEDMIEYIDTGV